MGTSKPELKLDSLGLSTTEHQFKKKDDFALFGNKLKKESNDHGPIFGAGGNLFANKSTDEKPLFGDEKDKE